jgi:threonine synthase
MPVIRCNQEWPVEKDLLSFRSPILVPVDYWHHLNHVVLGVGIIGIWRALEQLRELGWVSGTLPRLIVVQAAGCAPLVEAFDQGKDASAFWSDAKTIAAGLRVPKALGDFMVLAAVRETGGTAIAVSDDDILAAMRELASGAGILAAPEGAATLAAARQLRARGDLDEGDRVVLINTGTGMKYPEILARALV